METYIIEDVTVTNLDEVTTKLMDLLSKLEAIETVLNRMIGYIYDIQVYIRVILWCLGVGVSFAMAYWFYKTWIRSLIRQYWKFNI